MLGHLRRSVHHPVEVVKDVPQPEHVAPDVVAEVDAGLRGLRLARLRFQRLGRCVAEGVALLVDRVELEDHFPDALRKRLPVALLDLLSEPLEVVVELVTVGQERLQGVLKRLAVEEEDREHDLPEVVVRSASKATTLKAGGATTVTIFVTFDGRELSPKTLSPGNLAEGVQEQARVIQELLDQAAGDEETHIP